MRIFDAIKTLSGRRAARAEARRRLSHFVCGDCERYRMCGLPPRADCEYRLAQIARSGDRPRMQPVTTPAFWQG